jgi:hypothetical protein
MDSAFMDSFNALLDPVNAVADSAPGFVWRLQTEAGNATSLTIYGEENLLGFPAPDAEPSRTA